MGMYFFTKLFNNNLKRKEVIMLDAPGISLKSEFFGDLAADKAVVFDQTDVDFDSFSF